MCASRLLAAYFGTSLFIWASVIGLILVYLTVGYFIGGRLADRFPSEQVLCTITAMAALSISILPFVSQSILTWSITGLAQVSVSIFFSSLLGTILLFAVPVTLLGLVSPFAMRLMTKDIVRSVGRQAAHSMLSQRLAASWAHFCLYSGLSRLLACAAPCSSLAYCSSPLHFGG